MDLVTPKMAIPSTNTAMCLLNETTAVVAGHTSQVPTAPSGTDLALLLEDFFRVFVEVTRKFTVVILEIGTITVEATKAACPMMVAPACDGNRTLAEDFCQRHIFGPMFDAATVATLSIALIPLGVSLIVCSALITVATCGLGCCLYVPTFILGVITLVSSPILLALSAYSTLYQLGVLTLIVIVIPIAVVMPPIRIKRNKRVVVRRLFGSHGAYRLLLKCLRMLPTIILFVGGYYLPSLRVHIGVSMGIANTGVLQFVLPFVM